MSTAISEMDRERMVKAICCEPLSAACSGDSPRSIYREMFSIITIASSTTNPVEIVSAINVRLLRLNPMRYMAPNVPTSDNGTAAAGMIGRRQRPQEQKNDHDHERDGEHQFELHVTNRRTNGRGAIGQHRHLDGGGQRTLQLRQELLDAVCHLNDIRTRLPLDIDEHGRRLVHPGRLLDVFHIIDHIGHVGQMDGRAIAIRDDERLVFSAGQQLVGRIDDRCSAAARRRRLWPD